MEGRNQELKLAIYDRNDVVLPHRLLHEIHDLLVERLDLRYLDIGEFIRDVLRRRIEQLEHHEAERKKS